MGKKPDQIYREIVEHRDRMSAERSAIDQRVRSDLSNVKERISDRTAGLSDHVSERPLSYLAGGFGSGVVLGMLVPGLSIGGDGNGNGHSNGNQGSKGSSGGGGLMGMVSGTLVSAIDDTVRPLMQDVVAGFTGDDRPPEVRDRQQ